jgi:hypothetical protein
MEAVVIVETLGKFLENPTVQISENRSYNGD